MAVDFVPGYGPGDSGDCHGVAVRGGIGGGMEGELDRVGFGRNLFRFDSHPGGQTLEVQFDRRLEATGSFDPDGEVGGGVLDDVECIGVGVEAEAG